MRVKRLFLGILLTLSAACAAFGFAACVEEPAPCEHVYGEWTDITNDCEEHTQKRVCTLCGNEDERTLEASHSYGEWTDVVNTCEEHTQKRVCSACNGEEIRTLEASHSYGEWTDVVNTCEEHTQKRVCSVCNDEETRSLEASHSYGEWIDIINTCEEHTQKRVCSVCNDEETRTLEASHSYGEWIDIINTCEEHTQKRVCSVCNDEETRTLEAGHQFCEWYDTEVTCEYRIQTRVCPECGESENRTLESSHIYGEWVDYEVSCTQHTQKQTCSRCGDTKIRELPVEGHKFGEWRDKVNDCENHIRVRDCSVCGFEEEERLEAAHSYGEWTDKINTCSEHIIMCVCSVCGNEITSTASITVPHSYGEWEDIENTCEEHTQLRACTECGHEDRQSLKPSGHLYENGACKFCNTPFYDDNFEVLNKYNSTYGYEWFVENDYAAQAELYSRIDKEVKKFHTDATINAALSGGKYLVASVNYSDLGIDNTAAISVWKTYKDDNPLYYWLSTTVTYNTESINLLTESEYASGADRSRLNDLVYNKVNEYSNRLGATDNAYRKALCFHDLIIQEIDYAYGSDGNPEQALWAHSILGVVQSLGGVCESYARTYQLLLNYNGVENLFVTGKGNNENHAWNLVRLNDGNWYWCDLTWDDNPDWEWGIKYNYFLVNDTQNVNWSDISTSSSTHRTFLDSHTPSLPTGEAGDFLYGLPARSESVYYGNVEEEVLVRSTFIVGDCTYIVVGYDTVQFVKTTASGEVVIPETVTFRGIVYKVISIGSLRKIDGINLLGGSNSTLNNNVTTLFIPKSVIFIWDGVVQSALLENITVEEGNTRFASVDGVLYTASGLGLINYPTARRAEAYTIPDGCKYVASKAFINPYNYGRPLPYLKTLVLGATVGTFGYVGWGRFYDDAMNILSGEILYIAQSLEIEIVVADNPYYKKEGGVLYRKMGVGGRDETFWRLEAIADKTLTRITIGKDVYEVNGKAFQECETLELIEVEEGSEFFTAQDGVLYEVRSYTTEKFMVGVPAALKGAITVPDEVTCIGKLAGGLSWGKIFYKTKITEISFGINIKILGSNAFSDCTELKRINYAGTVEQWNAIEKDKSWCWSAGEFEVVCSDGTLDKNGNLINT